MISNKTVFNKTISNKRLRLNNNLSDVKQSVSGRGNLKRQDGVSLIEILITAVILAIGLLGVAALQITSVNSSQESYFRSQASAIAEDLSSRMKASKYQTYSINNVVPLADVINGYDGAGAAYNCAAPAVDCATANCTSAQMITYDIATVCQRARDELTDGEVFVSSNTNRVTIAVAWTPIAARSDAGQLEILNPQCGALGIAATKDCVILEMVP